MTAADEPLRIGIVAPCWLPVPAPGYGGTEAVVDQLARGLARAGHDVLMVCHPDSTCPVPTASVVPAEDTVRMGRASIELEHAIGAYELVKDRMIVHDHTLAGPIYSNRFPGLPVVTTNHNPFTRTMSALYGAVPEVALVAISRSHAESTKLPIAAVVHHGIDVADYPDGAGRGGYAAVLSRMAADKGIHRAILVARAAGVPLKIAAKMREPREQEYFDEYVRPFLGADVEYLGELDAVAKLELLADAVALVNPIAWREPFGMATLESLACGTPVVGCGLGAMPEIVTHGVTGFLGDTDEQLVDGLRNVGGLDRAACRARVRDHFSVEKMVDGYVALYRRLIG
ncbi:MAG: glycosyltransferase family 4 protein [Actinomycetota bacterium]|nr:glycosyltransferase family 4 protein [Actinomycetota bacterium]